MMPCVVRIVSYYSINDCPCDTIVCYLLGYSFLNEMCVIVIPSLASHIDTTALTDGTYEPILESDGGDPEVQVNAAELTEAPNQGCVS